MGLEDLADGLAVPHLLVGPAGEEGRDGRIAVGGGEQEVPQIADGVVLDIVHVAQCAERLRRQGLILEVIELDALEVQAARSCSVGIDGRSHNAYYSDHWIGLDGS
jgi:hypothetical protein